MKYKKPKFWDEKYFTIFSILLWPLSILYQLIIHIKKRLSHEKKFNIPIICIGNIYLGGTGKTPVALKLYEIFKKKKNPVIIKKNYKDQNDEITLLSKYAKVITNYDRYSSLEQAIKKKFDLVILDDGFQDFKLKRDLNIVCFNQNQEIGNGQTIPSGPLRENLSALERCKIVMINGNKNLEFEEKCRKFNKNLNFFYFKYLLKNLNNFKNKKLIPFAGIGNPSNFFDILKSNRLNIVSEVAFPDHYNYTDKDFDKLNTLEKKFNAKLVTTEKDYLRISKFLRKRFSMIEIKVEIENQEKLIETIEKYIK